MNGTPKRPSGDDAAAKFMQWVWDWITLKGKMVSAPGQIEFSYTSKGIVPRVIPSGRSAVTPTNPFKIYVTDEAALTFKVTTGKITTVATPFEPTNIDSTFTLTAGSPYFWFYLDLSSDEATIVTSDDPPEWSVNSVPLGYVDTSVDPSEITQLVRDHIFIPCA